MRVCVCLCVCVCDEHLDGCVLLQNINKDVCICLHRHRHHDNELFLEPASPLLPSGDQTSSLTPTGPFLLTGYGGKEVSCQIRGPGSVPGLHTWKRLFHVWLGAELQSCLNWVRRDRCWMTDSLIAPMLFVEFSTRGWIKKLPVGFRAPTGPTFLIFQLVCVD